MLRAPLALALALALAPLACTGNDDGASTGDTEGATSGEATTSTASTSGDASTSPWATTSTSGAAWQHECPDWTTTSYNTPPYGGSACKLETPGGYQFCSCRYHELCVGDVDLFFPGGAGIWGTAGVCGAPCGSDADCQPAPAGATATPTCAEIGGAKHCVLSCAGGKACPDGLFCSDPPLEACVAAEYAGGT